MRRRTTPKFWLLMIAIMLAIFGASFAVSQHRYAQGARALAEARAYRDALSLRVDALSEQLDYARTDDYIMRAARDELGMIMPSEVRYVSGG